MGKGPASESKKDRRDGLAGSHRKVKDVNEESMGNMMQPEGTGDSNDSSLSNDDRRKAERVRRGRQWWSEIDDAERIRRLRSEVKELNAAYNRISAKVRNLEDKFEAHFHGHDGKTALSLRDYLRSERGYDQCESEKSGKGPDDMYF